MVETDRKMTGGETIFTCTRCEANYTVPAPTNECPVCGHRTADTTKQMKATGVPPATVAKRLHNANVLVDAKHRAHWLQETCDLGAETIDALLASLSHTRAALEEAREALSFYGESDVITGRIVAGKISHINDDGETARKALIAVRAALNPDGGK